jgi:acetylornithine deacetylase/succinyl-diaminopimelate desuccinylase-like protein
VSAPALPEEVRAEALALFRALLRIDTTNPPGLERAACELLAESFRADGLEPVLVEKEKDRTSIVTRLRGTGELPPLLLTAHLDVVAAEASRWRHPPFGAVVEDGWLYGRGAIDMKHMAAMSTFVLKLLRREGVRLRRDVVFAGVADEETGCRLGSQFLVEEHPDLVRAEYALGEIGGYTQPLRGARLYPIMVAQKGMAWFRARVDGAPGHGSTPREDNAVLRLASALGRLTPGALPFKPTRPARALVEGFARASGFPGSVVLKLLLNPQLSALALRLIPDAGTRRSLAALLRNTVTPTVLRAGHKTNVIPSFAEAELDGRTVPGDGPAELEVELRKVLGPDVKLELLRSLESVEASPDTGMYRHLAAAVPSLDPEGVAVPLLVPGFTDAAPFTRLGTTFYGFSPVVFPPSPAVSFASLYHGDDERIPVAGFHRGLEVLLDVVRRWCA